MTTARKRHPVPHRLLAVVTENFDVSRTAATVVLSLVSLLIVIAIYWFIHSAPPRTLTIASGPPGSSFQNWSDRYRTILAKHGVTLIIRPTQGALENLKLLANPASGVDIGFVQGGLAGGTDLSDLVSLGSVANEPLWIFYRSPTRITLLSELAGRRLAIGPVGSGTHVLALSFLQSNGIKPGDQTTLLDTDADVAAPDLLAGKIDAVFLMGDSAPTQILQTLLRNTEVQLYTYGQADAYIRKFSFLNKIELHQGAFDLGKNLPAQDSSVVGPTVELVARENLHPALSDLLIETAQSVHGRPNPLQRSGEFPAALEHEFKISDDALRYYKSGKSFFYRFIPSFWLASLVNRILVAFVPLLLVLVPTLRLIPAAYQWRIRFRLFRWYRNLLLLEREAAGHLSTEQRRDIIQRLDDLERLVNRLKIPASFAEQFYNLRGHIHFVRSRLMATS